MTPVFSRYSLNDTCTRRKKGEKKYLFSRLFTEHMRTETEEHLNLLLQYFVFLNTSEDFLLIHFNCSKTTWGFGSPVIFSYAFTRSSKRLFANILYQLYPLQREREVLVFEQNLGLVLWFREADATFKASQIPSSMTILSYSFLPISRV